MGGPAGAYPWVVAVNRLDHHLEKIFADLGESEATRYARWRELHDGARTLWTTPTGYPARSEVACSVVEVGIDGSVMCRDGGTILTLPPGAAFAILACLAKARSYATP